MLLTGIWSDPVISSILLSGLIIAGVTYGPEMLGIVDAAAQKTGLKKDIIETPEELAEQTFDALKNKDFDALSELYMTEAEGRAWVDDVFELDIPDNGKILFLLKIFSLG